MKEEIMINLLGDDFSKALIAVAIAAGSGRTSKETADIAATGAINNANGETEIGVLTEAATTILKSQIGMA